MKNGAGAAGEMGKGTLEAPFPKVRDATSFKAWIILSQSDATLQSHLAAAWRVNPENRNRVDVSFWLRVRSNTSRPRCDRKGQRNVTKRFAISHFQGNRPHHE